MRKGIFLSIFLCFMLCGCSLQKLEEYGKMSSGIYEVSECKNESLKFRQSVMDEVYVEYDCYNFFTENEVNVSLYIEGNLIAENNNDFFKSDVSMKLLKHGNVLRVYEHVYYYDINDIERNFIYDRFTDIHIKNIGQANGQTYFVAYPLETNDLAWNLKENIRGFMLAYPMGVYNRTVIYNFYMMFSGSIGSLLLILVIYMREKNSILKEKYKIFTFLDILIFAMVVLMYFCDKQTINANISDYIIFRYDYQKYDAIFASIFMVAIILRLFIMLIIKLNFKYNPPKEYTGHKWIEVLDMGLKKEEDKNGRE